MCVHNPSELGKLTLDIQKGMIDFYELESKYKEKNTIKFCMYFLY